MPEDNWLDQIIARGDIPADYDFYSAPQTDTEPRYAVERLLGEPLDPTPTSFTTEPEWGFDVGERVVKSTQESFGAISAGLAAVADSVGVDGARDWFLEKSGELFEEAGSHDIVSTQFAEISNPIDLAKFTAEKVIEYLPDLVLMFAGGAGFATAAGKTATTAVGKTAAKTFAKKALDKNLKASAKRLGKDLADREVKELAYKTTLKEMGTLAGMASFEGFQGTGQMYASDVALRGVEEASPGAAFLGGAGQAAVAMISPFNRAIAGLSVKKGIRNVASMTFGEASEEVAQGIIEKVHAAGINDNLTMGEIFSDPQTYMELAEAGFVGALVGGVYGGAGEVVFGRKGEEDSKVVDPEDGGLVDESAKPKKTLWEAEGDKLTEYVNRHLAVPGTYTDLPVPAGGVLTTEGRIAPEALPEVPTATAEEMLAAPYEPSPPAPSPEVARLQQEAQTEAYEPGAPVTEGPRLDREARREGVAREEIARVEEEMGQEEIVLPPQVQEQLDAQKATFDAWAARFADKVLTSVGFRNKEVIPSKVDVAIQAKMDNIEADTNEVNLEKEAAKSIPNLKERNIARQAVKVKEAAIAKKVEEVVKEVTTPPTKEELEAQREIDMAEAIANVGGPTAAIPQAGVSVAAEEEGKRVEVSGPLVGAKATEVIRAKEEVDLPVPETTDADLQLILDNDIDGLVESLRTYKNPEGAYTELALKSKELVDEYPHLEQQVLSVLKAAYKPATERKGAVKTGGYQWDVKEGIAETTSPSTKKIYRVIESGDKGFVLVDEDFTKIVPELFKTSIKAREALENVVPIAEKVKATQAAKAKIAKKKEQAKKKSVKAMAGRVTKEKKEEILKPVETKPVEELRAEAKAASAKAAGKAPVKKVKAKVEEQVQEEVEKGEPEPVKTISVEQYKKEKAKEAAEEKAAVKKKAEKAVTLDSLGLQSMYEMAEPHIKKAAIAVLKKGEALTKYLYKMLKEIGKVAFKKFRSALVATHKAFNAHLESMKIGAEVGGVSTARGEVAPVIKEEKKKEKKVEKAPTSPEGTIAVEQEAESSTTRMERDEAYRKKNKVVPESMKSKALDFKKSAWKLFQDTFVTVSERLRRDFPKVFLAMRKMENQIQKYNLIHLKGIKPFIKGMKAVSAGDEFSLSRALKNGDTETRDIILKKYNLTRDFKDVQKVLKNIEERAEVVGLLDIKIENYFPRSVKDADGLMAHYKKDPDTYSRVQYEIDAADKASGYSLSETDKAELVTRLLASGSYSYIPVPGASKKRKIGYVVRELNQYYHTSTDALTSHIVEMNDKIEARVMMGKSNRSKLMSGISKVADKIGELVKKDKLTSEQQSTLDGLNNEYDLLYNKITNVEAEVDESISKYILEDSRGKGKPELAIELVRSRLKQSGTYGAVSTVRNIAYAITLGSPTSAITQIGDLTWSIYRNNPINTMKGAARAIRLMINKKGLTQEHFDFSHALQEMGSMGTNQILDTTLKWTGLKGMDLFAKETAMQSTMMKWAKESNRADFVKTHTDAFGSKVAADKVWRDIKAGNITEDVVFALFNDLSDWQPISLMEMPKGYLEAGNMRVFYMLKTFSIKALNSIHREVYTEFKKGDYEAGARKLVGLVLALSLSGAAADELKDFLLGKESSIRDNTIDNMIQLFMVNKYAAARGMKTDTFMTSMIDSLIPPVRFADDFIADLYAASSKDKDFKFKTLKNVPIIGKVAWSHMEYGREAELKGRKEDIYKLVRKSITGEVDQRELRRQIREYAQDTREYNKGKRGDDRLSPITTTAIKNLKRRERKKENK